MIDPKLLDYPNVPFLAAAFSPFHLIKGWTVQKADQSLTSLFHFLMPSFSFLALMSTGCLLYWLTLALLSRFKRSTSPSSRRKLQLKILAFFSLLFLFFVGQFFVSNLNTRKVVVSTDQLLYSKDQILKTQKEFCFFEIGAEFDFLKNLSRFIDGFDDCPDHLNISFRRRRTLYFTKSSISETRRTPAIWPTKIKWATFSPGGQRTFFYSCRSFH